MESVRRSNMLLFDSTNFKDKNVNYLDFSDSFKINVSNDKIKIILGSNGIGKSSIYRNIQQRFPDFCYIDYSDVRESILKTGNSFVIGSKISKIEELNKQIQSIEDKADIHNTFRTVFDLGSIVKCNQISDKLNLYRSDTFKAFSKFSGEKLDDLFDLDISLKKFFVHYGRQLINQSIIETTVEMINNSYREKILEFIDSFLIGDEYVCPVCGSKCADTIKNIVKKLLLELKSSTDKIVKEYIEINPNTSQDSVLKDINYIKSVIKDNNIMIENVEDFIICGGQREKAKYILDNKEKYLNLKCEIESLESSKKAFFDNLMKNELRIKNTFINQLKIPESNIVFDNKRFELIIIPNLAISKYSTGEINLITFIVTLLEFINSDKTTLIIDDPLSSYDLPNQYKIMYEITAANSNKDKTILIFTHNIDCINIANSQRKTMYEFELMDRINNNLYLNPIKELSDKGFHISYILEKLSSRTDYLYTKYLKLLNEKDSLDPDKDQHKIFHYDMKYSNSFDGVTYSNEDLVNIIDNLNYDDLSNADTIINSANKILYLAAIRVWVEKQFYNNCSDLTGLKDHKFFSDKITFMLDNHKWTGTVDIQKDFLMSKKVMLNQNDHIDSQKEPFYFALSMSTDDIFKEIVDIKNHFINN